jgi:threonine synthase
MRYTGLIEKYRDRLPVGEKTRLISLGEGNTPLIKLGKHSMRNGHSG